MIGAEKWSETYGWLPTTQLSWPGSKIEQIACLHFPRQPAAPEDFAFVPTIEINTHDCDPSDVNSARLPGALEALDSIGMAPLAS